jgi:hypothetical protein
MLTKKLKRAETGLKETKPIYEEHCMYVGQQKQELYLEQEKKAERERGEALKIYQVSWADGKCHLIVELLLYLFQPLVKPKFFKSCLVRIQRMGQSQDN